MKRIKLSNSKKSAMVNDEDFARISSMRGDWKTGLP
jgi:hypothetical protein